MRNNIFSICCWFVLMLSIWLDFGWLIHLVISFIPVSIIYSECQDFITKNHLYDSEDV